MTSWPLSLMRLVGRAVGRGLPKTPVPLGLVPGTVLADQDVGLAGQVVASTVVWPAAAARPRCQSVSHARRRWEGYYDQAEPSTDCHSLWRLGLPPAAYSRPLAPVAA